MGALNYRQLGGQCGQNLTCPAVLDEAEVPSVIVIGAFLPDDEIAQLSDKIGPGETALRLPKDVFEEAIRAYAR